MTGSLTLSACALIPPPVQRRTPGQVQVLSGSPERHEWRRPENVITVRYYVFYPSATLWPLTRTEGRALLERTNPAFRTSARIQDSQALSADAYQCRTARDPATLGGTG
jgi:hypothetical protein